MRPVSRLLRESDQQTWGEHCLERAIGAVSDLLPCLESRDLRIEAARFLTVLVAQRTPAQVKRLEISKGLRA